MGAGSFEVRQAGPAQEGEVLKLWARLMEDYGKKARPGVLEESYRYVLAHPEQVNVFVALEEGKVIGTVSLHLGHFSTWNNNWYGHVEDLIVDPGERGRGVAASLLRHVLEAAKEEKLSRLELHTLKENRTARELYEKLGFEGSSILFDLPVNK